MTIKGQAWIHSIYLLNQSSIEQQADVHSTHRQTHTHTVYSVHMYIHSALVNVIHLFISPPLNDIHEAINGHYY